jgi:uncharacterized membrane protein
VTRYLLPERLFLILVVPLTCLYFFAYDALRGYYHNTERFLHVGYVAHRILGGEQNTLPLGLVRYAVSFGRTAHTKITIAPTTFHDLRQERDLLRSAGEARTKCPLCITLEKDYLVYYRSDPNPIVYSPVSYSIELLPFVLGIAAGLPPAAILWAAQIFKAFCMITLAWFILRITPIFKWQTLVLLLLPTVCMQRIIIMSDVITTELCLLFIAMVLRAYADDVEKHRKRLFFSAMAMVALLIGQCKSVYVGVTALAYILPKHMFGSRQKQLLLATLMVALSVGSSMAWSWYVTSTYGRVHHFTWSIPRAESRLAEINENPEEKIDRLASLAQSPRQYHKLFTNQIFWEEKRRMENVDIAFYALWLASCLFLLPFEKRLSLKPAARAMSVLIFTGTLAIIVLVSYLLFITMRTEGRYLLPILPLLWLGIYGNFSLRKVSAVAISVALVAGVLYLNLFTLGKLSGI